MNWLDIIIPITIGLFFFAGYKNGALRTLVSLVFVVIGTVLAGPSYSLVAGYLTFIPSESIADVVAFIIILAAVLGLSFALAAVLVRSTKAILPGRLNGVIGGILGAFMGFFTTSALLMVWADFGGSATTVEESFFATAFLNYFFLVLNFFPEHFSIIRDFMR